MARVIDADALVELIKKEQSRFENAGYDEWCNGIYLGLDKAIDEIDDAPTVDAVPVVRCKDCISYKPHYLPGLQKNDNCGICDRYPFLSEDHKFRTETDFCSYGERKNNEDNT